MKAFFEDVLKYTHHSNGLLIEKLLENPEFYSENISLLSSHILDAHHIWNHRIFGKSPSLSVWQPVEINRLPELNDENFEHSKQIIQQRDFSEKINYTNSKGFIYTNSIQEILFHIINHSTYHRGQIVSLLKTKGVEPIATDYIFYKR